MEIVQAETPATEDGDKKKRKKHEGETPDEKAERKRRKAEKKAATAAPKMVVPMALFILPSLFAVVGGPLVVGLAPLWKALGVE